MNITTNIVATNPTAIVDREALKAAMDKIKLVVEKSSTVPILQNVHLSAERGNLVLTGTDLDMDIRISVPGEVDARIATTVPSGLLQSMCVKAPKAERVTLTMLPGAPDPDLPVGAFASDAMELVFGRSKYQLKSLPAAEFAMMDRRPDEAKHHFTMSGSTFWNALDAVRGAISTEETRYYLNGIYLYAHSKKALRAVATDGHRLYCQEMLAPEGAQDMPGVIIPRKTINILHQLLKGKSCPPNVSITVGSKVEISWPGVEIITKVIDGTFPDYQRVVPTNNDKVASFDSRELDEATQAAMLITSTRGKAVKMSFAHDACTVSVNDAENGSSEATVNCPLNFHAMQIGFNSTYLREMIANACPAGGEFTMKFEDANAPVLIRGTINGWTGVLMPTRI